jgi:hypothetical protein
MTGSRRNRLLLGLAWAVIQLAVIVAGLVGGALAGYSLSLHVFTGGPANDLVDEGLAAGIAVALAVNHYARGWVRRLRLGLLRGWGVMAEGQAGSLRSSRTASVRGARTASYTAQAEWTDPATGVRWHGERRYHFIQFTSDLTSRHARRFEAALSYGAPIRVYYPEGRPQRFIIDIPFSSTMADFFLAAAESYPVKAPKDPVAASRKAAQRRNRPRRPPRPARRRR